MASRVLKNNTASPVTISDVGQSVPASGQLVINPIDYGKYEGSSDVITFIGDLTLTVSDGTFDLSVNEGTRLIQGGFSRPISDGSDPTIKASVRSFGGQRTAMHTNNCVFVPWSVMKTFWDDRKLPLSYFLNDSIYWIFTAEGPITYQTSIAFVSPTPGGSEQEDFENNYQSTIDINKTPIGTKLVGNDGIYAADVVLNSGVRRLQTNADVTVNSLRGFDPIADTWFWIGTEINSTGVGDPGDTVTVSIAAATDNPTLFPAINNATTVLVGDDEDDLADRIVTNLNADLNFNPWYFARKVNDIAVMVHLTSRIPGPAYERPNPNDFEVFTTGTTIVTRAFDNLKRRQKNTSLARDPSNPTLGQLGISGSVVAGEGDVTGRIIEYATNGGSDDLRVNGSTTPVQFRIESSPDKERFFTSLRFDALGNGIQFTNFLSRNGALTNGVLITIRSRDEQVSFPPIRTTEDFASVFSRGPSDFDVYDVSGTDYFRATLNFSAPFQLFKQGTFSVDDFIQVTIRDDIRNGIQQFKFIGFGFERDF